MPRKFFKRWIPNPAELKKRPGLKFLGTLLDDPNLFHLNRHSVSVAFAVGLFIAFIPMPGQIPLAAVGALIFRCNLPISVALIWISNPLTFPIIYYGAYKLGNRILQMPEQRFAFELSWEWLAGGFQQVWEPLVLGCLMASFFFSAVGYLTIQWMWRWHVIKRWKNRQLDEEE